MNVGGTGSGDGGPITIRGVTYAKGLGTNSVSSVATDLGIGFGGKHSQGWAQRHEAAGYVCSGGWVEHRNAAAGSVHLRREGRRVPCGLEC
jgi:hypothetical protein